MKKTKPNGSLTPRCAKHPDKTQLQDRIVSLLHASMPAKSPKPRFERQPVKDNAGRVESYCSACGKFVAASDKPAVLRIAEKAHICPMLRPTQ
jgi:hypothetical protein